MSIGTHTLKIATVGIGALALVTGGLGVAAASNGDSLSLGHHNTATKTTTLTDSHGTPLRLNGPASSPPLKVASKKVVSKLNAQYLDGKTAADLVKQLKTSSVSELAALSQGAGTAFCPAGTHPTGGGVFPDFTGMSDTDAPFVAFSDMDINSSNQLDGWIAAIGDFDGTYDGLGDVSVSCATGTITLPAAQAAQLRRAQQRGLAALRAHHVAR